MTVLYAILRWPTLTVPKAISFTSQCLDQHLVHFFTNSLQVSHKSLLSLAAVSREFSQRLELLKQWEADIASMIQLLTDTQRRLEFPGLTDAQMQQASVDAELDLAFSSRNSDVYDRLALLVATAEYLVAGRENMAERENIAGHRNIAGHDNMAALMELASHCGGPEVELEMAHAVLMRAFWDVSAFPI